MDGTGQLDHQVIEKIRDLKKDLHDKVTDALREKAMSDVKVDAMAKKIAEIE